MKEKTFWEPGQAIRKTLNQRTSSYLQLAFIFLIIVLYSACSSTYKTLDEPTKKLLVNKFNTGNAQLDCRISCISTVMSALPRLKVLHDTGHWKQLALETQGIGFGNDLTWYYLGRAAEELNAIEAAEIYYKISIENTNSKHRCKKRLCNGHQFPHDTSKRLSHLKSSVGNNYSTKHLPRHSLYVNVEPASAVIKIMNIQPKFRQGIKLTPGGYRLKLQKRGFQTVNKMINIQDSDVTVSFIMKPIKINQNGNTEFVSDDNQFIISTPDTNKTTKNIQISDEKTTAILIESGELKNKPNPFSAVKTTLNRGEKVIIIETQGDWVKIETNHGVGYVYKESLRLH